MLSLVILLAASVIDGLAFERRDSVPSGYIAAPYYPSKA